MVLEILDNYIVNPYLRAAAIVVGIFIVLRIVVFIFEKVFLALTKKTKTDVDDILVKKSTKPISLLILLFGLRLAIMEFTIPEFVLNIVTNLIYTFMIITAGYLAYVIIDLLILRMWKKIAKKTKTTVDDTLASLIHTFLKVVWIVFVILYILNLWGVQIGPFLAGLGIGGIALAFAMQESLANIFGGISIILDKTVKVGDFLYLRNSDTRAEVTHVGLRSTKVKTLDNEVIIIPNSIVANTEVQNIAQPEPKIRIRIPFSVSYGSDINKVKKLILGEMKKIKLVEKDPEPKVMFMLMNNSSLDFEARIFVESVEKRRAAIDEANTRIYNALNKAGIIIPFPQMDVHMKK